MRTHYVFIISLLILIIPISIKAQSEPCTDPASHDFDYMLGEWQVSVKDTVLAYSVFKKQYGNCTVQESYKEPGKYYFRSSTATYNTIKGKWEVCTYDNKGEYYVFTGSMKGRDLILESEKQLNATKKLYVQLVYTNIFENSFEVELRIAFDSTKTYKSFQKQQYKRIRNTDYTGKVIKKEITVKASPAEIYDRWTTKSGILKFFGEDAYIIMEPGGPYEIYFTGGPKGMRGSEGCTVLSFIENKMLSFTWNAPPQFASIRNGDAKTWVVVQIEPLDETHTKVVLTHNGWRSGEEWNNVYSYFDKAWTKVMEWLRDSF